MKPLAFLFLLLGGVGVSEEFTYTSIDRSIIQERLNQFKHPNKERGLALRTLFEQAGCRGENLSELPVSRSKSPNLSCTLTGATNRRIVVGGHFDYVTTGDGVVDNWSGSSLLPSLYQSMANTPRRHTFQFIGFASEEKGLVGSRDFVYHLQKSGLQEISAMVNLDSLGLTPTKVEHDRADPRLFDALFRISKATNAPLSVMNVHQVGRSDSDSFQDKKVPTICIHSVTPETFPVLHSRRDRINAIQFDDYYQSYKLITAYLTYLDQLLDSDRQ